jgi:hypothetical protein
MADPFDEALAQLNAVEISRLWNLCICADCPTYNACAKDAKELLYCIYGRSFHCVTDDLGCICPGCPVVEKIGLVNLTFCLYDSEAGMRYAKKSV